MRIHLRTAAAAAGLLLAAQLIPAAAQAAGAAVATAESATSLAQQLDSPGVYFDAASGRMVITVTSEAAAERARTSGALVRTVARSAATLTAATSTLAREATVAGTAWSVDPVTNQVVLQIDSTVTGARLAQVQAAAAKLGDAVRTEYTAGTFSTFISGGSAIYGSSYRCSLGFNVRNSAGTYYFLTAGHCGNLATSWYSNSSHTTLIGTRRGTSFPTNDYAIITYAAGISHPGNISTGQDIASAANAYVGEAVKRTGSTTGTHGGTVQGLNATVNYAEGTVYGMIRTNVCAEGGDSGGSLYNGTIALGLTSGGSGNCSSGGTTFFQPVTEPLSVYGVSVY